MPIKIEITDIAKNEEMIVTKTYMSYLGIAVRVLNIAIDTASFMVDSPKTSKKSVPPTPAERKMASVATGSVAAMSAPRTLR